MEVTARTFYQGTATDDYVQITLTDEEDIPDGMQKLRTIYPNLLGLSYDNLRTRTQQTIDFDSKIKQKVRNSCLKNFTKSRTISQ